METKSAAREVRRTRTTRSRPSRGPGRTCRSSTSSSCASSCPTTWTRRSRRSTWTRRARVRVSGWPVSGQAGNCCPRFTPRFGEVLCTCHNVGKLRKSEVNKGQVNKVAQLPTDRPECFCRVFSDCSGSASPPGAAQSRFQRLATEKRTAGRRHYTAGCQVFMVFSNHAGHRSVPQAT